MFTLFNPTTDITTSYVPHGKEIRNAEGIIINSKEISFPKGVSMDFDEETAAFLKKRYGFLKNSEAESQIEVPKEQEMSKEELIERQLDPALQDEIHSMKNKDLRMKARILGKTFKVGTTNQEIINWITSSVSSTDPINSLQNA